ncbi:branched-chain amino acid transport system II carrier protein [Actinomyces massiliensis]|uniref:branched-chain amino acid transport system II carrier protein n=1 Tax=Actinomyces massiliensis TaxID=461393 RepID=UPI0028E3BF73|nr:branched-chain amino acid transport system II carrier protein [Actinomyces massiliensis]
MTSTTDRLESPSPATSIVTTGLMLFALFFGAGNLIFPPLLGAASGGSLPMVMIGFLVTGVLLPLATIVAVSTSGEGILGLARRVGPRFGAVMPLAVYLSIGPFYAVPRVTTVAYELATLPVLELLGIHNSSWAQAAHVAVFLGISILIALRPSRLADSIGRWLTPALLLLLVVLCGATILTAPGVDRPAIEPYASAPMTTGLTQGYLTMDVLSASVFGIVVISSLRERGFTAPGRLVRGTTIAGGIAAVLLGAVYIGLALIGTRSPGDVTSETTEGTELLRAAASLTLGRGGVIVFAGIVVLACLTTAVGLLASWAGYAYTAWPAVSFNRQLTAGTLVSFVLANLGLKAILKITAPLLFLLYPLAICLVVVTLVDALAPGRLRAAYLWPVGVAGVLGLVSALTEAGWTTPSDLLSRTGLWDNSTGWIVPALLALGIGLVLDVRAGRWSTPVEDASGASLEVEHAAASQH